MTDVDDMLAPAPSATGIREESPSVTGSSDGLGVVHVWVKAGRLVKVRLSPLWRSKLGPRTLDECFTRALATANLDVAAPAKQAAQDFGHVDFSEVPRFTVESFSAFQQAFEEIEQRWDDALERREEQQTIPFTFTEGVSRGVTVFLDAAGVADQVLFDTRWLDTAQPSDVSTHVLRAARSAYDRYVPPQDDRDEIDMLEAEHSFLMAAFETMLNPGGRHDRRL